MASVGGGETPKRWEWGQTQPGLGVMHAPTLIHRRQQSNQLKNTAITRLWINYAKEV